MNGTVVENQSEGPDRAMLAFLRSLPDSVRPYFYSRLSAHLHFARIPESDVFDAAHEIESLLSAGEGDKRLGASLFARTVLDFLFLRLATDLTDPCHVATFQNAYGAEDVIWRDMNRARTKWLQLRNRELSEQMLLNFAKHVQ